MKNVLNKIKRLCKPKILRYHCPSCSLIVSVRANRKFTRCHHCGQDHNISVKGSSVAVDITSSSHGKVFVPKAL